jgi:two-component system OmpR family sensor kinase
MSLRARLALGIGAVIVTLLTAMVTVTTLERNFVIGQLDRELRSLPLDIPDMPPPEARPTPPPPPFSNLFIGRIGPDGTLRPVITGRLLDDEPAVSPADVAGAGPEGRTFTVDGRQGRDRFRVLAVRRADGTSWNIAALPVTETDEALARLALTLGLAAVAIVAVLLLTGWWMVRLGLRPIARITEAADAISAGEHGHRVALNDPRTEAGRLGRAFNVMLDERDAVDAHLRQFLADAAHELRTPLTSIRGYLDLHAQGGFRSPAALDEVAGRMRSESHRMAQLVEDLLLLANLDQDVPLAREPVDLADVLNDAAADGLAVQPARPLSVDVPDEPGELTVVGDERHLREVLAELVRNALVHTPENTVVRLGGHRNGHTVEIAVADRGPGLTDADAARVFDRFFRGDPSRQRPTGGSGLGLSIARAIVEAQHGTLTLDTAPGRGCTFRIRLPASAPGPGTGAG